MTANARGGETESSTAAYAILGLLANHGPQTTYDLKRLIESSIGYFWPFPHSQLYAETQRLESAGFVDTETESHGRRRKTLKLSDSGRVHLRAFTSRADDAASEIRDIGLLKLFVFDPGDTDGIVALAMRQRALHDSRLAEYESLAEGFDGDHSPGRHTLHLGLAYERVAIEFWDSVIDEFAEN